MAEEKEQNTPQDEQPEAEQPVEAEPAAEAPAEEAEMPAAEETPEEPAGEEAAPAGDEPAAEAAEAPSAPAPPKPASSDDEEGPPSPKQLRKQEKSRFKGPAGPQRSVDDRVQERTESRSSKAQARSRWRRARREKQRSAAAGAPAETPAAPSRPRGERKVRQGVVVSSKADKTITVRIDLVRSHRVYGKVVRNSGTLHAHDESNQANEGDVVRVVECRPLSRTKRWRLLDVLEKAR